MNQLEDFEDDDNAVSFPEKTGVELKSIPFSPTSRIPNNVATEFEPISPVKQPVANAHEEEHLGENFEDSPWLPPSIAKAKEFKKTSVFRMGNAPLTSVNLVNAPDLGTGVSLYFQFAKSMAICMLFTSILSIPSIVFCYFGQRIPEQDRDAMGFYRFTLGNIGYDPQSQSYLADSSCRSPLNANSNSTCLHFPGGKEITLTEASGVLTAMEFLQIFVFFISIWHLQRKVAVRKQKNSLCKMSNYSIMVRNLPPDCTTEELVKHFSELYPLDKPDWKKRPHVLEARPLQHCRNSGNEVHLGHWVAECIIHRRIGSIISVFKNQQHLMEALYRSRAEAKMYAEGTCHKAGAKPLKYDAAMKQMRANKDAIDKLAQRQLRKQRLKLSNRASMIVAPAPAGDVEAPGDTSPRSTHGENTNNSSSKKSSSNDDGHIQAEPVAAFVCFEYSESMARCVEDYSRYSKFPYSLCYPAPLRFKQRRLRIQKAPEPDEIVWENLEVGKLSQWFRRTRTALVTLVLLIGSFAVILQATTYQTLLAQNIPNLGLCLNDIPALYANNSAAISPAVMKMVSPLAADIKALDDLCASAVPGSFYATFIENGDRNTPVGHYDINVCSAELANRANVTYNGLCPKLGQKVFCPCVTTFSQEMCASVVCADDPNNPSCQHFPEATVGDCFCLSQLLGLISGGGVTSAVNKIKSESSGYCQSFLINYAKATSLSYLAMFVTVFVNTYLMQCLSRLTEMESHSSADKQQGSMMYKMFLSTYFNIAILVILASARVGSAPVALQKLHILQGEYSDFDSGWYGKIGTYFMTSFIIQCVSPLLTDLTMYLVIAPLYRLLYYGSIRKLSSTSIVMQSELNNLEVGPVFDITTNQAQLLSLLFFSMTYAAGLPLVMPLACAAFCLYFSIDKLLLCRYNQRPLYIAEGIMEIVMSCLPYAAIIRLAVACWMFGNPTLLVGTVQSFGSASVQGSSVSTNSYQNLLSMGTGAAASNSGGGIGFLLARIGLPNVFPLFVLLVVIIVFKILRVVLKNSPIYWFFAGVITSCCKRSSKVADASMLDVHGGIHGFHLHKLNHPLRQEQAPFTGEYFKFLRDKMANTDTCWNKLFGSFFVTDLTESERSDNWEVADPGNLGRYFKKVKLWEATRVIGGEERPGGAQKRTYEVINDHGCSSYNMEKIPAYAMAMKGLKQGTSSLMKNSPRKVAPV